MTHLIVNNAICDGKKLVTFMSSSCLVLTVHFNLQIARRRNAHIQRYPDAKVISLGIGDTTEPIPTVITGAMEAVKLKLCCHRF